MPGAMPFLALPWTVRPPERYRGGAVTVGNFDGVHRGHAELVRAAQAWATRVGGPAVAVTFDPPPGAVLAPDRARPPLSTVPDRAELLLAAGADHVVALGADAGLVSLSPEAFFEDVVVGLFAAKAVVEGANFRFGRARGGDTALLRSLCDAAGIAFEVVPPVTAGGEAVSSSRVRASLAAGDVAIAAGLLGRPYRVSGVVEAGAKRGRTIGFPTANLGRIATVLPPDGVYAGRAVVAGTAWPAAVNVGPNPTFGDAARKVEVHLLDFAGDLYGRGVGLEFVERLRATRPFAGPAELVAQLTRDVAAARAAVAAVAPGA